MEKDPNRKQSGAVGKNTPQFSGSPAEYLRIHKLRVVTRWADAARREILAANDIATITLIDSLPEFLEDLADSLDRGKIDLELAQAEDSKSKEHGANRAEQSRYSLVQVQQEYRILQKALFEELEEAVSLTQQDREIIFESIMNGMRGASAKFAEILLEHEREALRAAKESTATLNALVHSAPLAIAFLDRDLHYVTVNENLARFNGAPIEKHIGRHIREVLPGRSGRIEKVLRGILETGKPVLNFEIEDRENSGQSKWYLASYYPVKTNDGEAIGIGGAVVDVTAQKQSEIQLREREKALRETQARYDFALSAGRIGVWEMSLRSPEIIWSSRQFEIFGVDPATKPLTYSVFLNAIHPEDRPKVDAEYEAAVRERRDLKLEYRIIHPKKGIRWVDASGHIYFDPLGAPERMIGVNFDITDAKQIEIRRTEKARLLNLTQDAVLICDENRRIIYWNKGAENIYGYSQEESIGKFSADLLKTEMPAPIEEIYQELRERGYWSGEVTQTTKSGKRITVLRRLIYDKREDGTIRILKTDSDISERKRYEESLRESEARFRELANGLPQIIWTARADGVVDWYNDWWYKYIDNPACTGWDDEKTMPMHPDDMAETKVLWSATVAKGDPFLTEQRFRRGSDGEYRWHLVRGVPIRGSDGRVLKYVGANTDIHDQKIATQALLEERSLRERFVGALTHDLRNPLAAAKISAQIVLKHRNDSIKRDRYLSKIIDAIERVDQMIGDLLDANKIEAGEKLPLKISECDIRDFVSQSLEELSVLYGDRFVLKDDGSCVGHWSCDGLRRVIDNLVTNAVKYGAPDAPVTVTLNHDNTHARIRVHNEGNELSPAELKGLFSLYRRSNKADASEVKGWGIGLTLVKGIVESHGGRVLAESGQGKGTTFTVELPIHAALD